MKDVGRVALLFDFYGPLLTERQQELVRDYYLNDLSLGEIAEAAGVSRQAVHDQIRRAETALEEAEQKLGLVAAFLMEQQHLRELQELLRVPSLRGGELLRARQLVDALLSEEESEPQRKGVSP